MILTSPLLISNLKVSLLFFKKFRNPPRVKDIGHLAKALNRYNRSSGFRFSPKRLSFICQYAEHIYALNLPDCIHDFESRMDNIIRALENGQLSEIPENLLEISTSCNNFTQKYQSLGIEFKSSHWIRAKDALASSFSKIVPNLIWLMILFIVWFLLRDFIPFQISLR